MFILKDIYERYSKDVYFYLVSLTHDALLSEDLTSETFLRFIKSAGGFKGECDIKTYLFVIARRCFFKHLRSKHTELSYDDMAGLYLFDSIDLDDRTYKNQLAQRINSLLDAEPEKSRNIVKLRIDGFSYYEIAKKFDISEGAARVIDYRTKKKIKETLVKEGFSYE